ncbi:hypothetical protein [Bacillus sp. SJS]|uniref:hypothetical protein n=1 Tax=Bacillus sp. SJS TaxID=1423321 RepID=UPI0004DCFA9B|nr:hypothetical protein [Bacillus sp. SJS]KZZ83973.1 hypothetical protein AS29_012290 [Bacillus sp. SJS]
MLDLLDGLLDILKWFEWEYSSAVNGFNDRFQEYILSIDLKLLDADPDYVLKTRAELDQHMKRERL